jgi:hypothetical protein
MTAEEVEQWFGSFNAKCAAEYYRGNRTLAEYYNFLNERGRSQNIKMFELLDRLEYEYSEEIVREIKGNLLPILAWNRYDYQKVEAALLKKGESV